MSDPIIVTRDKVKREWSDFEPKLVAALLAGEGAGVLVTLLSPALKNVGIELTPDLARQIMLAAAGLIGWWTHSVGTTVTKKVAANVVSETHSGATVSTFTAPTAIQRPAPATVAPSQVEPTVAAPTVGPDDPTQVIAPPYSRGASILSQLSSAQDDGSH